MTILVKICGISTEEALEAAIEAGADYAGFVFFERSPRNITLSRAAALAAACRTANQDSGADGERGGRRD